VGGFYFLVIKLAQLLDLVQKCDAKRPCSLCILAERISECVYHDQENPQPADTRSSHGTEDHQSGRRFGGVAQLKIHTIISICSPAELSSTTSPSDITQAVGYEPTVLRTPEVDQAQHGHSSGLSLVCRNLFEQNIPWDSNLSISIFSSFPSLSSVIPPQPWIPLSFLGDEKLQVQFSEIDATDLDMRSYVPEQEVISHKLTLGRQSVVGSASAGQVRGPVHPQKNGGFHTWGSVGYSVEPWHCERGSCPRNVVLFGCQGHTHHAEILCEAGPNSVGMPC